MELGAFLYCPEFMVSFRTFFAGCKTMMYIFGVKRQSSATDALRLMETQSVVIWIWKKKRTLFYNMIEMFLSNETFRG